MRAVIGTIAGKKGAPPSEEGGFIVRSPPGAPSWGPELDWIVTPEVVRDSQSHTAAHTYKKRSNRRVWLVFNVPLDGTIPDWGELDEAARAGGISYMTLAHWFTSPNFMDRAKAWQVYGTAYGWDEIDDKWQELSLADIEQVYGLPTSKYSQGQPQTTDVYSLDDFTRQYLETALWSSTDESTPAGGEPLDANYDITDIAQETLDKMIKDCEDFQQAEAADLALAYQHPGYDEGSAGHDFWLDRNGHGVGFWDRGLGAIGDRLSKAADAYGTTYLYVGDDDMVHSD